MHPVGHRRNEVRHRDIYLVGPKVQIGCQREGTGKLRKDGVHLTHALKGLHRVPHGTFEGGAVARHVDFRDHHDAIQTGIGFQLSTLLLRVETTLVACHCGIGGELRIALHLETPRLVLGEMPVEGIHFESREQSDLSFQVVEGNERAARVVHKATQLEGRPVGDGHGLNAGTALITLGELLQGLCRTDDSRRCDGLNANAVLVHVKSVGLVLIAIEAVVVAAGNLVDESHLHPELRLRHQLTPVLLKHAAQQPAVGGVAEHYLPSHRKHPATLLHSDLLRLGQQVIGASFRKASGKQHQDGNEDISQHLNVSTS